MEGKPDREKLRDNVKNGFCESCGDAWAQACNSRKSPWWKQSLELQNTDFKSEVSPPAILTQCSWSYFGPILDNNPQDYIANAWAALPCSQSAPYSGPELGFTLDQSNKSPIWPTSRFCNCCNRSHECTWWLPDYKSRDLCHLMLTSLINAIDCLKKKTDENCDMISREKESSKSFFMWHLTINNPKQIKLFF